MLRPYRNKAIVKVYKPDEKGGLRTYYESLDMEGLRWGEIIDVSENIPHVEIGTKVLVQIGGAVELGDYQFIVDINDILIAETDE
jgi:hypothetical protein